MFRARLVWDCYRNCFFLAKYIDLKLANYKEALSRYVIIHDVDALGNKGADLDALGNHTGAIEYYDKALAINPKDVDAISKAYSVIPTVRYAIDL
jgi:tetratricopeptide (TPR) repeat protein